MQEHINTVLLSNLYHQRDSTVPHRTETLPFKNAVTFKREFFDPPWHVTLHSKNTPLHQSLH